MQEKTLQFSQLAWKITLFITALLILSACKLSVRNSTVSMHETGKRVVRVAVKSHVNCDYTKVSNPTHYLDSDDGELMFEEVEELDRGTYGFSGDVAIGRTSAHTVTTMEDIEARCRRLIISVDAPFETKPTISFTKGFAPIGQREKFLQDFNYGGISGIHCHNDQFCSFKYIKKWQRHFIYVEPDNQSKSIEAKVRVGNQSYPITLKGIYRANPLPTIAPDIARVRQLLLDLRNGGNGFEMGTLKKTQEGFAGFENYAKVVNKYNYCPVVGKDYYAVEADGVVFYMYENALQFIKKCGGSIRFWIGRYRGVGFGFYLFSPDPGSGRGPNFTVETDKEEFDYYHPVHLWVGRDGKLKVGRTKKRGYTDPRHIHPNADLTEYGSFDPVTCSPIAAEFADYESTKTYNSAVTSCKG